MPTWTLHIPNSREREEQRLRYFYEAFRADPNVLRVDYHTSETDDPYYATMTVVISDEGDGQPATPELRHLDLRFPLRPRRPNARHGLTLEEQQQLQEALRVYAEQGLTETDAQLVRDFSPSNPNAFVLPLTSGSVFLIDGSSPPVGADGPNQDRPTAWARILDEDEDL